jgi:hypothetical protein
MFLSHFLQVDSIVLNPFIRLYFIHAVPKHLGFIKQAVLVVFVEFQAVLLVVRDE